MISAKSRRSFCKDLAVISIAPLASRMARGSAMLTALPISKTESLTRSRLQAFNYEGVQLLPGMLESQVRATRDFYLAIPDDDILKGFRQRAGMQAPGNDLGGWYSGDPKVTRWWSKGDTFNVFGQWLSGMARLAKARDDEALREKTVHLMIEWSKTIEDDGFFFYSRHPNAPHYTYDKTLCGLIDLYEYCGRQDALAHAEKITGWAVANLDRIRRPNVDTNEWYTLSENLYRAYVLTGDRKYRSFGDVWQYTAYWKFFTGESKLDPSPSHWHAYSHVNTLSGAAMAYEVTGEEQYLKTIVNAYNWLERTQLYATGGYGSEEDLRLPGESLSESLETTFRTFETICGCWAAFKLARYLMQFTGEARYGDWIERLVYNGIGAALPMAPEGQTFYYSDYRFGGGRKIYHIDGTWPCCSGTYPQVVADYHNLIYFRDQDGLYVNLFIPSVVNWSYKNNDISLKQETAYPESDTTTLTVASRIPIDFKLRFRVPGWANGSRVKVNELPLAMNARPGTWAEISRTWKTGDRVTIQFAMTFRTIPIDSEHPKRVAFVYGPVVLVQKLDSIMMPSREILKRMPDHQTLTFSAPGQPSGEFVPFYAVGAGIPYNMYFDLKS
jgi:uncharacterized protein